MLINEIKNLLNSKKLKKYIILLDGKERFNYKKEILNKMQTGYCEDLCIYMFFKYKNIKVLEINTKHFIFFYKGKYYDSLTLNGVKHIKDIPFFKNKIIKRVRKWNVKEIPKYYKTNWNKLKCVGN